MHGYCAAIYCCTICKNVYTRGMYYGSGLLFSSFENGTGLPIFTITYGDLCRQLSTTKDTVRWCQEKKLLPSVRVCACGQQCRIVKRPSYPEGECFRCPRKGCQKVTSFRTGTVFENSNLPLEKLITCGQQSPHYVK